MQKNKRGTGKAEGIKLNYFIMKRTFITGLLILLFAGLYPQQWKPAGDRIKTDWAWQIDPGNPLPEYPRPQMVRNDWKNLNGLWNYAITVKGASEPVKYDGKILVPFAVESSLSGVQRTVGKDSVLWYECSFTVPSEWSDRDVLLNFGAVDWHAEIWINNIKTGSHKGGYDPFSFNITPFLRKEGEQKLVVRVWDPTNDSFQPRGKQVNRPGGIWYTAVTGIWQTVWIEPVNRQYINNIHMVPDIDNGKLYVEVFTQGMLQGDYFEVVAKEGNMIVGDAKAKTGESAEVSVKNAKLWSPESPFLYDLEIKLISNGEEVDLVNSYFAMRKISTSRDDNGIIRLQLNNKDYFQLGTLDQGWWPDGLYTAPSDDALLYDIQKTRDMGFNMIRKHVKVEPARWYTHCDRIGMLVWQDMPSGDRSPGWQNHDYFEGNELMRSTGSEAVYRTEWKEIMDFLYSNPSVVCWVPFNEAWGQFSTVEIAEWTKDFDPSRLVNPASGGNFFHTGDILDLHNYPNPELYLYDAMRANVLGEYGGIGLVVKDHLWTPDRNWGYVQFKSSKEATDKYVEFGEQLLKLIRAGFTAAIYTQTTDVEIEVNGLMTYDRKIIKLEEDRIREINRRICRSLEK